MWRPPGRHTYGPRVDAERRVRACSGRKHGVMAAKRPTGSTDRRAANTEPCSRIQRGAGKQPGAPCHRIPITRYKRIVGKLQHFTEVRKRGGQRGAWGEGASHANTESDNEQIVNAQAQIHTLF